MCSSDLADRPSEKAQHDSFGGGRMLLLAELRRIRRIRSLGHSLHRLTATMPFRHLTLKWPFYNGFVGTVPRIFLGFSLAVEEINKLQLLVDFKSVRMMATMSTMPITSTPEHIRSRSFLSGTGRAFTSGEPGIFS